MTDIRPVQPARGKAEGTPTPSPQPRAQPRVALPVGSAEAGAHVLDFVEVLLAQYAAESPAVEVVAYGSGAALFAVDGPHGRRLQDQFEAGVVFSACARTVGQDALHLAVRRVASGVVRLVELEKAGYTLIQP